MSLRRLPSQLDDDDGADEVDYSAMPIITGYSVSCEGTLIRTSFEGEELSTDSFTFQLSAPQCAGGDIKSSIRETCKIDKEEFHDVGYEIGAKPLVKRGSLSVKKSATGPKVIYEYFQGCCGHVVELEFAHGENSVAIPVTVTTRAKPAAMPAGTRVYVALSVNEEDIRNDYKHLETWRVDVLRLNLGIGQFQLSSHRVGKTYRREPEEGDPAVLKGAGEAVQEAISSGKISKVGTCDQNITLHAARMEGGKLVDTDLVASQASESLVEWEQAHFDRAPKRWTKVWLFAGEEGSPSCGSSAKQPWLEYKQASPYCSAICVPSSDSSSFSCEPAWSGAAPGTLA